RQDNARTGKQAHAGKLIGAILEAEATVHFLQRSYRFVMEANLLKLLPSTPDTNNVASNVVSSANASSPTVGAQFIAPSTNAPSANASSPNVGAQFIAPSTNAPNATITANASSLFDSTIEQSFAEA